MARPRRARTGGAARRRARRCRSSRWRRGGTSVSARPVDRVLDALGARQAADRGEQRHPRALLGERSSATAASVARIDAGGDDRDPQQVVGRARVVVPVPLAIARTTAITPSAAVARALPGHRERERRQHERRREDHLVRREMSIAPGRLQDEREHDPAGDPRAATRGPAVRREPSSHGAILPARRPHRAAVRPASCPSTRSSSRPWWLLDADLGEAGGPVQGQAGVVGGEHAARELVVAGLLGGVGERVHELAGRRPCRARRGRRRRRAPPRPRTRAAPSTRTRGRSRGRCRSRSVATRNGRPSSSQPSISFGRRGRVSNVAWRSCDAVVVDRRDRLARRSRACRAVISITRRPRGAVCRAFVGLVELPLGLGDLGRDPRAIGPRGAVKYSRCSRSIRRVEALIGLRGRAHTARRVALFRTTGERVSCVRNTASGSLPATACPAL